MSGSSRPARRRVTAQQEEIRVSPPKEEAKDDQKKEDEQTEIKEKQEQPAGPHPKEGGQVPGQVGTQVGTSTGTSVARTEESPKVEGLDFSLRGALSDPPVPEQDWRKSGWQALRFRKKAVEAAIRFKWRGFRTEQELVDAALAAFLPEELQATAREMAERGEL